MAWPQHYVLVGNKKERPTYDSLKPTQWMAGVIKAALDLSEPDRTSNLQYVASLLEDASDFSFENAKACHAVVLSYIEHDKFTWQDTNELDRCRRQHAQKHDAPVPKMQHGGPVKKQDSLDVKMIPCKFYNTSRCSKQQTHFTKGTWYLHLCSTCKGDHSASTCKPKN